MKLITLASVCASTKKVSRTRTLIDSISTRVSTALGARLNQIALADFADDLRATPYRTALDGPSKTALDVIEAADAFIIGAAATRIGSFPSLLLHLLELCDPDQLRGKPAIFISVGGSGAAPHLVSLQCAISPVSPGCGPYRYFLRKKPGCDNFWTTKTRVSNSQMHCGA